jgi:hypothetical protein
VDAELDSLHVKKISIENLVDDIYIVRVDTSGETKRPVEYRRHTWKKILCSHIVN